MKLIYFSFIILFCISLNTRGQSFTVIDSVPDGAYGTAAWGDFDNDGWKDLVYIAQAGPAPNDMCLVLHNVNNSFHAVAQYFPHLFNAAAKWDDLDGDGFDDLVMNGADSTFVPRTLIYRSLGNGTFTSMPNTIPGLSAGSVAIADYNNDGFRDIAVTGFDSLGAHHAYIFKGTAPWTWNDIHAQLEGIHFGEMQWGDLDNDSLPDLVINGIGDMDFRTRIYKNMGADSFLVQPVYMAGTGGTLDLADLDNDGWLDVLVTGYDSTSTNNITELHHNNGNGTFTLLTTNLPEFGEPSAVAIADFNNDSLLDVCFTGGNLIFPGTNSALAINTGTNTYTIQPFHVGSIQNCILETADIDGDGDADVFISNKILRNDGPLGLQSPDMALGMYPNPCHDRLFVSLTGKATIDVTDMGGRAVLSRSAWNEINGELDVSSLVPGLYMVRVFYGDKPASNGVIAVY